MQEFRRLNANLGAARDRVELLAGSSETSLPIGGQVKYGKPADAVSSAVIQHVGQSCHDAMFQAFLASLHAQW